MNRHLPRLLMIAALLAPSLADEDRPQHVGTICIDPGHPSETSAGCTAADGTTENHVNWVIGNLLKDRLEARGHKVVMTKQREDELVTNRRRAEIANEANAHLLLRLHCDTGHGHGYTFYYADRPGRHGDDVGPPQAMCDESGKAAKALLAGMHDRLGDALHDNGIKTDRQTAVGAKQGALTGSIYARVPAVTIEMVFLSDRDDTQWIENKDHQHLMVEALTRGCERWLDDLAAAAEGR
jgi:N-acetylmuramoyl-L-alanine amidase